MEFHPVSNLFPMMSPEEFEALKIDIQKNGLLELIWTHEGKIIDGRNRYNACIAINAQPRFRRWNGEEGDLVAFVLSLNLRRRHLTIPQAAMVAARAREYYDKQAKERQRFSQGRGIKGKENLPDLKPEQGQARDHAAKAVGVSGKSVDAATKVLKHAVPEVVKAVDSGRMAVSTAAVLATKPPDFQRQEASNPKPRSVYTLERNGSPKSISQKTEEKEESKEIKLLGMGVILAHEAINCLKRIPKDDALRKAGFQRVTDWIRHNQ